jgi:transcriptional regulator with XRE-family HTH domain
MSKIIATTRCYATECGGTMEGRKGEYRYTESGLSSVVLKDILVFHCTKCNAIVPKIPAAGVLHRVLAMQILSKKTLLTGGEIRFLRKLCGYSVTDFSEIMGSSKTVISRWENDHPHGDATDRLVRFLVMSKLVREIAGEPEPILKNVTVEQLNSQVESAIRVIVTGKNKAGEEQQYVISPEEMARFGTLESHDADAVSVN